MRRNERGTALVWALMLTMLAAALGGILLNRGRAVTGATQEDTVTVRGLHAAEGGLEHARVKLAADPAYKGETIVVGACTVTVTVTLECETWRVKSHAQPGNAIIEAMLTPRPKHLPSVASWRER